MDNELARELIETTKLLTESVKLQQQLIQDQLMPCFCIMAALVKGLPSEEQKNLLSFLQSVSEAVEPLAQAEGIESPYSKAIKLVSALAHGDAVEPSTLQQFKLILGGKKEI